MIALMMYKTGQYTNWAKVEDQLGLQVLALTRYYEQTYGVPTGTNSFATHFAEAEVVANQIEKQMVPLSSILTNVPHTPDVKITIPNQ